MQILFALVACDWFNYPPDPPPTPPPLTLTTIGGEVTTLPDPEHVLIVEAVRSLDWCVWCVAQVRAWQEALPRVHALDAKLVVLSPDPPDVLARMVDKRGFHDVDFASVQPATFERLGIPADPDRSDLPQATTLVLDPQGAEILRYGDPNYRERADPGVTLNWIAVGRGLPPAEAPGFPSPDWDGAATIGLLREGDRLVLDMVLSAGFHVYGAKEPTSIPVTLRLDDGTEAEVPPGARIDRAGAAAWVLSGNVRLSVPAPVEETVSGEVGWQLCNDRACSAPRHERFTLDPEQGRIIRP